MKLSIITINRNNAAGLRKTIESVVSQTYTDFEYIIIDGASTDESVDVIKEYADKITFWVSEPDNGIYNAMNKGILKAKGEYLLFLNSGDWFCNKTTLEDVFELNREEDLIYGDIISYNSEEEKIPDIYPDQITGLRLFETTICHQSIFHKRSLYNNDKYKENYRVVSDWEFLVRKVIFENCTTYKVNQFIFFLEKKVDGDWGELTKNERQAVLNDLFPKRILNDYTFFLQQLHQPLNPYVQIFSKYPKLQRSIKRIMKLYLILKGKRKLIPR
jgi:glycosyltransferase involved in cell wall biosynthesis